MCNAIKVESVSKLGRRRSKRENIEMKENVGSKIFHRDRDEGDLNKW